MTLCCNRCVYNVCGTERVLTIQLVGGVEKDFGKKVAFTLALKGCVETSLEQKAAQYILEREQYVHMYCAGHRKRKVNIVQTTGDGESVHLVFQL